MITTAQSGNPLQPIAPEGIFPGVNLRPNVNGSLGVTGRPTQWFGDPTAFSAPCTSLGGVTTCSPGDMGRNSVIGPSFVNTDLSLLKNTKITEAVNLQFRAEAFDIFNHPNFGNPNLNVGSSNFGSITSTRFPNGDFGSARQVQLALKLQF